METFPLILTLLTVLIVLSALIGIGTIISNLLILRACQKMYTEYFKDRSMNKRVEITCQDSKLQ